MNYISQNIFWQKLDIWGNRRSKKGHDQNSVSSREETAHETYFHMYMMQYMLQYMMEYMQNTIYSRRWDNFLQDSPSDLQANRKWGQTKYHNWYGKDWLSFSCDVVDMFRQCGIWTQNDPRIVGKGNSKNGISAFHFIQINPSGFNYFFQLWYSVHFHISEIISYLIFQKSS